MRRTLIVLMFLGACGGGKADAPADAATNADVEVADAAVADLGDATDAAIFSDPDPSTRSPDLVDGTTPLDAPILSLLGARHETVTVENAASHQATLDEAESALRATALESADRIATVCRTRGVSDVAATLDCHYLLGIVSSPASITLLRERATLAVPAPAEDAHLHESPPERDALGSAIDALGQLSRSGDEAAAEALLELMVDDDGRTRTLAIDVALRSMPRRRVRRAVMENLPPEEHWRLYEVRP